MSLIIRYMGPKRIFLTQIFVPGLTHFLNMAARKGRKYELTCGSEGCSSVMRGEGQKKNSHVQSLLQIALSEFP